MQRDHRRRANRLGERQRPQVGVGVDDVEVGRSREDIGQHAQVQVRSDVHHLGSRHAITQRCADHRLQNGPRPRGAGGEQGDLVTGCGQPVTEIGDDALCPAVGGGRNVLVERGDLGDAHHEASFAVPCSGCEVAEARSIPARTLRTGVRRRSLRHQLGSAAGAWHRKDRGGTLVGGRGRLHAASLPWRLAAHASFPQVGA